MSGVRTKVGITEISSKLSAKTAFMNPIKANNIEVKNNTKIVKAGLAIENLDKKIGSHKIQ